MLSSDTPRLEFSNLFELKRALSSHKLPIKEWGKGTTKSVARLLNEYMRGDCSFILEDTKLVRVVTRVQARIFHDSTQEYLIEAEQFFKQTGAIRKRSKNVSVSEKIRSDETFIAGIIRCLHEELSIDPSELEGEVFGPFNKRWKPAKESSSYPGLLTLRRNVRCTWYMHSKFYKPEGYIEEQDYRKTTFKWIPNPAPQKS